MQFKTKHYFALFTTAGLLAAGLGCQREDFSNDVAAQNSKAAEEVKVEILVKDQRTTVGNVGEAANVDAAVQDAPVGSTGATMAPNGAGAPTNYNPGGYPGNGYSPNMGGYQGAQPGYGAPGIGTPGLGGTGLGGMVGGPPLGGPGGPGIGGPGGPGIGGPGGPGFGGPGIGGPGFGGPGFGGPGFGGPGFGGPGIGGPGFGGPGFGGPGFGGPGFGPGFGPGPIGPFGPFGPFAPGFIAPFFPFLVNDAIRDDDDRGRRREKGCRKHECGRRHRRSLDDR